MFKAKWRSSQEVRGEEETPLTNTWATKMSYRCHAAVSNIYKMKLQLFSFFLLWPPITFWTKCSWEERREKLVSKMVFFFLSHLFLFWFTFRRYSACAFPFSSWCWRRRRRGRLSQLILCWSGRRSRGRGRKRWSSIRSVRKKNSKKLLTLFLSFFLSFFRFIFFFFFLISRERIFDTLSFFEWDSNPEISLPTQIFSLRISSAILPLASRWSDSET